METVLIAGNTSAFSRKDILRTADRFRLTMISFGEQADLDKTNLENVNYYHLGNTLDDLSHLFHAQSFAAVWYISGCVDDGICNPLESDWIPKLFAECRSAKIEKIVFLSSLEGQKISRLSASAEAVATLEIRQVEELAAEAAGDKIKLITLRLPRLSGDGYSNTWLQSIFEKLSAGEEIKLPYSRESRLDLISAEEVLSLLCHITDEISDQSNEYAVVSGYPMTYGKLAEELKKAEAGVSVHFGDGAGRYDWPDYPQDLRLAYGFVPVGNELERLGERYRNYKERGNQGLASIGERKTRRLGAWQRVLPVFELLLFLGITEYVSRYTADSVYFRFIDVRLAYVVLMGCVYGLRFGLIAAAAECAMIVRQYAALGISATMIFYNVSFWIPFAVYLAAGAVAGYIENMRREKILEQEREIHFARDKYLFLKYVYEESLENQASYRQQIWSFKDSYGKIVSFVKLLNHEAVEEICSAALEVLETGMNLRSVLIYRLDEPGASASLYCRSRQCPDGCAEIIGGEEMSEYKLACTQADVWRNRTFDDTRPFCARIVDGGEGRRFLIMLRNVEAVNMNTWYVNQFRVLCDLIEIFLQRASVESGR